MIKTAWKENNIPFSFQHAAGINIAKYTAQPTSESDTSVTGNMWADCRCISLDPAETLPLWATPASHSPLYVSMWQDSDSSWARVRFRSPWVPFHLLLVTEAEEAGADARGHPGADFVEEPLEGEETGHRDGEDKLAEWVHGHPTQLREDGEKEGRG